MSGDGAGGTGEESGEIVVGPGEIPAMAAEESAEGGEDAPQGGAECRAPRALESVGGGDAFQMSPIWLGKCRGGAARKGRDAGGGC